jgi:hypothetical protein
MPIKRKKCVVNFLKFTTLIRLDTLDFGIEKSLNMWLKLQKDTRSLSTVMHQINSEEFAKIIDKIDVIFKSANG